MFLPPKQGVLGTIGLETWPWSVNVTFFSGFPESGALRKLTPLAIFVMLTLSPQAQLRNPGPFLLLLTLVTEVSLDIIKTRAVKPVL